MAMPSVTYGFIMVFTSAAFGLLVARRRVWTPGYLKPVPGSGEGRAGSGAPRS
jgi:hypothetical protein